MKATAVRASLGAVFAGSVLVLIGTVMIHDGYYIPEDSWNIVQQKARQVKKGTIMQGYVTFIAFMGISTGFAGMALEASPLYREQEWKCVPRKSRGSAIGGPPPMRRPLGGGGNGT